MRKIASLSLCCFFAVMYGTASNAQIAYEPTWSPPDLMALNNIRFNPVVNATIERGQKKDSPKPTRGTEYITNDVNVRYIPSLSRRQKNLSNFVNKTRAVDPAGAAKMEQLFASTDIIQAMGNAIAPYGLRVDNVADTYAVYWISAWEAAHGIIGSQGSPAKAQAVRDQVIRGIAATQAFASATDAQKQEYAEALLVQAALISATAEAAAGDSAQLRAVGDAVRKGAKASGLDLDAMTLTEDGFKPAKGRKTGAADTNGKETNPASEPTATAANDAPTQSSGSTTQYALIAAAGGAGLAGVFLFGKAMGKKG
jgi:hypothetical protein